MWRSKELSIKEVFSIAFVHQFSCQPWQSHVGRTLYHKEQMRNYDNPWEMGMAGRENQIEPCLMVHFHSENDKSKRVGMGYHVLAESVLRDRKWLSIWRTRAEPGFFRQGGGCGWARWGMQILVLGPNKCNFFCMVGKGKKICMVEKEFFWGVGACPSRPRWRKREKIRYLARLFQQWSEVHKILGEKRSKWFNWHYFCTRVKVMNGIVSHNINKSIMNVYNAVFLFLFFHLSFLVIMCSEQWISKKLMEILDVDVFWVMEIIQLSIFHYDIF